MIIEPYYQGIVLSGSARLKTTLRIFKGMDVNNSDIKITCKSSQMGDKIWIFNLSIDKSDESLKFSIKLNSDESDSGHEFTLAILTTFFTLLPNLKTVTHEQFSGFVENLSYIQSLEFDFLGDDSLYSFIPEESGDHKSEKKELGKTGMGSSATFITSFIGALYSFVTQQKYETDLSLNEINILSQIANSVWQKKIGSGFDIAAAAYGSLLFRRYTVTKEFTQIVESIENLISNKPNDNLTSYYIKFYQEFDFIPNRLQLPNWFKLCMVSTSSGSDTRVMVKQLMQWSEENKQQWEGNENSIFTNIHWQNLATIGLNIAESIEQARIAEQQESNSIDDYLEDSPKSLKESIENLQELNDQMRQELIAITEKSGVQVEPKRVTKILNEIKTRVKNTIMWGVPGAGGDDAVYILYYSISEDQKEERRKISEVTMKLILIKY